MSEFIVDVIVNNYNYGRYLHDAIDSALEQTYPHVRVIVVDDGSTDDSRRVIGSYGSEIVAIFKDNGGQASALNAGFERSSGDAVVFLDADDKLVADIADRIAAAFSEDSALAKVQFPMDVIDHRGRRTGGRKPSQHVSLRSGDLREQKLAFPFDVAWMATSGNAFARWSLVRIFPIPEEDFIVLADMYLNHLVPLLGTVRSFETVGACYRVHGSNSYELGEASLDLEHVRRTIVVTDRVRPHLAVLARKEGLHVPGGVFLSVSDVGLRMISLRLDPDHHPIRNETVAQLLVRARRAIARRFDVRWPMKLAFLLWFAAMAIAPRVLVRVLAERFLFPERRELLNRVLAAFHRADSKVARRSAPCE